MDPVELKKITSLQDRVARLTHRTLLSILQLFDEDELFFYPNMEQEQESANNSRETAVPNARDTATALLAIEHSQDIMRRDEASNQSMDVAHSRKKNPKQLRFRKWLRKRFQEHRTDLDVSLQNFRNGKTVALSYEPYRWGVFTQSLDRIANAKFRVKASTNRRHTLHRAKALTIKQVLHSTAVPGESPAWTPFNCARVLALLHKYPAEDTHKALYMEALDGVLLAITQSYAPHYVFGGASLTGGEPHAYVAHDCLMALAGLADVLEKRAMEHQAFSELLKKTDKWFIDDQDPFSKTYSSEKSLKNFLRDQLAGFQNPVGLSGPILILERFAASSFRRTSTKHKALAKQLVIALRGRVTNWLSQFERLVSRKSRQVDQDANKLYRDLKPAQLGSSAGMEKEPGAGSMEATRRHMLLAGTLW